MLLEGAGELELDFGDDDYLPSMAIMEQEGSVGVNFI